MGFTRPGFLYCIIYLLLLAMTCTILIYTIVEVSFLNDKFYPKLFIKGDSVASIFALTFVLINVCCTCLMLFVSRPPITRVFFGVITAFTTLVMFVICIGFAIAIRGHFRKAITNAATKSQENPALVAEFVLKYCQSGNCDQAINRYVKKRTKTAGNAGITLSIIYVPIQIFAIIIFFIKGPHLCGNDV